jgi:hypothetical protein
MRPQDAAASRFARRTHCRITAASGHEIARYMTDETTVRMVMSVKDPIAACGDDSTWVSSFPAPADIAATRMHLRPRPEVNNARYLRTRAHIVLSRVGYDIRVGFPKARHERTGNHAACLLLRRRLVGAGDRVLERAEPIRERLVVLARN